MTSGMKTLVYPVSDPARAKVLYRALLGVEPSMDEPYYVAFDVDDLHVGLDSRGQTGGTSGPIAYWHVDDVNASVDLLLANGAQPRQPVRDVGGGKLIAVVDDGDGNAIGLVQER